MKYYTPVTPSEVSLSTYYGLKIVVVPWMQEDFLLVPSDGPMQPSLPGHVMSEDGSKGAQRPAEPAQDSCKEVPPPPRASEPSANL